MKVFVVGLLCLLPSLFADPVRAEPLADLTISQTDNAVQLFDAFTAKATVTFSEASTSHCVWLLEEPAPAVCTDITAKTGGWRICRKSGQPDPVIWVFLATEGYNQQVCVIAEDTGVVLRRSRR
jgi:hypothetical protein